MKFVRKPAKYTLYGNKRNQYTIKEVKTESVFEKISSYKINGYDMFPEWTDLDSGTLL
jgi:hypothetical protein